jgi:hypothetical protein
MINKIKWRKENGSRQALLVVDNVDLIFKELLRCHSWALQ